MSRLGRKPLPIPAGVEVKIEGAKLHAKGPKGALTIDAPPGIVFAIEADGLRAKYSQEEGPATANAFLGLARGLALNILVGVSKGYEKNLEIQGVGFKAALDGKKLSVSLGFATPVQFDIPDGLDVKVADNTNIAVSGADKQLVGDYTARIRSAFPAEPYKGKGIRLKGERVRRKVGKTVA